MADTKQSKKSTKPKKHRTTSKQPSGRSAPSKGARKPAHDPDDSIRPHFLVREELLLAARNKGEETGLGETSVPHIVRIGLTEYVEQHTDDEGQIKYLPVHEKLRALAAATKERGAPREVTHEFNAYLAAIRQAGFSLAYLGPFLDVSRQRIHQRADAGEARAQELNEPLPVIDVAPAGAGLPDGPQVDRSFPMKRRLYNNAREVSGALGEALSDVVDEILDAYVKGDMEVTYRRRRTMDNPLDPSNPPKKPADPKAS